MPKYSNSNIPNLCPLCKRGDALTRPWLDSQGRSIRTCMGLNRPEHLGQQYRFDIETGQPLQAVDGTQSRCLSLISLGEPHDFRGYSGRFLCDICGVTAIGVVDLDERTQAVMPSLGLWAREVAHAGNIVSQLPIQRGARIVGMQFRAFSEDGDDHEKQIRNFGESEGLFVPHYACWNPSAVVIHEGPWGAIAAMWDTQEYKCRDIFSVAVLSASVKATTIISTLELIFPGVPRFSILDQDPAGVAARLATLHVAKPILITGAGHGKDYRDLAPEARFERLADIVMAELKVLEVHHG